MDEALLQVYVQVQQMYHCSVDALMCTPEYRDAFLSRSRQILGNQPEQLLLARLMNLRKRSKVPRTR